MRYSGPELYRADAVVDLMAKAGFGRAGIEVLDMVHVVMGADLEGLVEFASGRFTDPARKYWRGDETERWGEVLQEVLGEEKREYGGVKFEGWAVLAVK